MSDCVKLANCPFFHDRMANMPSMAEIYKQRYCQGSNEGCARWLIHQTFGSAEVPNDLFPNDMERARAMVDSGAIA